VGGGGSLRKKEVVGRAPREGHGKKRHGKRMLKKRKKIGSSCNRERGEKGGRQVFNQQKTGGGVTWGKGNRGARGGTETKQNTTVRRGGAFRFGRGKPGQGGGGRRIGCHGKKRWGRKKKSACGEGKIDVGKSRGISLVGQGGQNSAGRFTL